MCFNRSCKCCLVWLKINMFANIFSDSRCQPHVTSDQFSLFRYFLVSIRSRGAKKSVQNYDLSFERRNCLLKSSSSFVRKITMKFATNFGQCYKTFLGGRQQILKFQMSYSNLHLHQEKVFETKLTVPRGNIFKLLVLSTRKRN